jgi:hypothetical protein
MILRCGADPIIDGGGGEVVFEVGGVHHLLVQKAEFRTIRHMALANRCRALTLGLLP